MRIAAMICGLLGGLAGLLGSGCALLIGGIGSEFDLPDAGTVVGLGWAATLFSILGLIGGGLAMGKPRIGGILMLVAAVGGVISVSAAYFFAGALLLVGGILGVLAKQAGTKDAAAGSGTETAS